MPRQVGPYLDCVVCVMYVMQCRVLTCCAFQQHEEQQHWRPKGGQGKSRSGLTVLGRSVPLAVGFCGFAEAKMHRKVGTCLKCGVHLSAGCHPLCVLQHKEQRFWRPRRAQGHL